MMKKKFMTLALTAAMAASMGMTAFAGQWVQNTTGWWWQEDNGSYPVSQWKWLDGNKDGIYECYAFDSNGYIYTNTTTPDGYTVNADGAWTIGNSVQLKYQKDMDSQNNSGNASDNNQSTSSDDSTVYTNEDMVGTFMTNDENREDYFELMVGVGDSIAAFYYDNDGDTHIYNFAKSSDTKYRDSSNSRNMTIVDYDTIIVNDKTYIRE